MQKFRHLLREDGQTMAEYGVMLTIITALVMSAIMLLSESFVGVLERVTDLIASSS
jgi:Flp pilus assembly pilin Flp